MTKINTNENNTPIIICKNNKTLIDSLIKNLILSIVSSQKIDNKEFIINKINNDAYHDIIFLKGKEIKKEQIKEIYNHCFRIGVEGFNLKFLIIDNIEDCSLIILNSLLKFIENPPNGLWILFLTNNINKIIATIKSRCLIQKDNSLNKEIELPIEWKEYSDNLLNAFSTKQEIFDFLNSSISSIIKEFITLYKSFEEENFFKMLDIFKELDYINILILFKLIYVFEDNKNIFELINNINLNHNKPLLFYKLIEGKIK